MARKARRVVTVSVALSLAPGVSIAHARREVRSRINDLCEYHSWIGSGETSRPAEESDVRVRSIK